MPSNETFTETVSQLQLGGFPVLTEPVTIAAGEGVLKAGAVLGKVTADGTYKLALAASGDGSETPARILANDVDATSEATAHTYVSGQLNQNELTLGAGITLAALGDVLDGTPVFLADPLTLQS